MQPYRLKTYHFGNSHDLSGTINALRVAAERFDADADAMKAAFPGHPIARQFTDQAEQARRIAADLEALEA